MGKYVALTVLAALLTFGVGIGLIWFYFGQVDERDRIASQRMSSAIEKLQQQQRQDFIRQHERR